MPLTVGGRAFVPAHGQFADVVRTDFLGLKDSPVVHMDDGTMVAFAGQRVLTDLVDKDTGKNGLDESVALPLDVKVVGIGALTGFGVDPATQTAMFAQWMTALTPDQRATYTQQWEAALAAGGDQLTQFLSGMVAALS